MEREKPDSTNFTICLQPALGSCDSGGFYAIAGAQLADRFGKIIPHGAVGEAEFDCDIAAGHAFSSAAEYLTFAVGEGIHFSPGFGREFRMNYAQSLMHSSDSVGQLFGAHIFQQI